MADAGFYRGTNADQDGRFTDKEKKLLKQMKFEDNLERKIDMARVNLDIIKPWISMRIAEILGIEDDVVTEYVFTQLEEKTLNPKVMQINITGFLNARRAREFMGELWKLLIEAEESEDGIPQTLVEKKLSEMRMGANGDRERSQKKDNVAVVVAESDWKHRYTTLSGGSYSGPMIKREKDDRIYTEKDAPPRRERDPSRERSPRVDRAEERRREFDEREKKRLERREEEKKREAEELERRRKDRERREEERRAEEKRRREKERGRERERERERAERRRRSRSDSRSPQRRRKFTEGKRKRSPSASGSDSDEKRSKKRKKHSRRDNDEMERRERKERKRVKKEKKKKERRRSPTPSSGSASDTE